jgi:hypothetical protein
MQRYHRSGKLLLTNCDPTQWATSPWEVAKAFVSPLGNFNAVDNQPEDSILAKVSANDFDPATLFILPQYCLAFQGATVVLPDGTTHTFPVSIDKARWAAALTARNHTPGHLHALRGGLELVPYVKAMAALEALLNDPALHVSGEPYVSPPLFVNTVTCVCEYCSLLCPFFTPSANGTSANVGAALLIYIRALVTSCIIVHIVYAYLFVFTCATRHQVRQECRVGATATRFDKKSVLFR